MPTLYCEACGTDEHGGDDWFCSRLRLSDRPRNHLSAVLCARCNSMWTAGPGPEYTLAHLVLDRRNSTCPLIQLQRLRANEHGNGFTFEVAALELQANDRLYELVEAAVAYKNGTMLPEDVTTAARKL